MFRQVEITEIFPSIRISTVLAIAGCGWVLEVTGRFAQKSRHILPASQVARRVKYSVLFRGTFYIGVPYCEYHECTEEVFERIDVVHPISPENGELRVRDEHSRESDQSSDQHRNEESGRWRVGGVSGNELRHPGVEHLIEEHREDDGSSGSWGKIEPGCRIPATPEDHRTNNEIRQLRDDLTDAEDDPRIEFCLLLSLFEDISIRDEFRLRLNHDSRRNEDEIEKGELLLIMALNATYHSVLQIRVLVAYIPVTEPDEKRDDDMEHDFVHDILSVTEELHSATLRP